MSGVVAIVGRPNVGKSTLFNRLIGERKSIVNDRPGVTRDRIYGMGEINGEEVHFIDTGGFEPRPEHKIFDQIRIQAEVAIAADVLLFVVDRVSGITATDERTALPYSEKCYPLLMKTNSLYWSTNVTSLSMSKMPLSFGHWDSLTFSVFQPNTGRECSNYMEAITERLPKRKRRGRRSANRGCTSLLL